MDHKNRKYLKYVLVSLIHLKVLMLIYSNVRKNSTTLDVLSPKAPTALRTPTALASCGIELRTVLRQSSVQSTRPADRSKGALLKAQSNLHHS